MNSSRRQAIWRAVEALAFAILTSAALLSTGQAAPFQNLGFDSPNVFQQGFEEGSTQDVLPGWEVFHDDTPQTVVGFNAARIFPNDLTWIDLVASSDASSGLDYFLSLGTGGSDSFSLVQRGDIPADTPFLRIRKEYEWDLAINGQPINTVLDTQPGGSTAFSDSWSVQVFDVSKFAGQNVEIRLTTVTSNFPYWKTFWLDDVEFIAQVPEPRVGALVFTALATQFLAAVGSSIIGRARLGAKGNKARVVYRASVADDALIQL